VIRVGRPGRIPSRILGTIISVAVFFWLLSLLFKAWSFLVGGLGAPYAEMAVFGFFPIIIASSSAAIVLWGKASHRASNSHGDSR